MGAEFYDCLSFNTFFTITINYYSLQLILTAEASLHSASRSATGYKRPLLSPTKFRHGPRTENTLKIPYITNASIVFRGVFMLPLHRNDNSSIVACVLVVERMCLATRYLAIRYKVIGPSFFSVDTLYMPHTCQLIKSMPCRIACPQYTGVMPCLRPTPTTDPGSLDSKPISTSKPLTRDL
jgi:hypothetical protein